MKEEKEACQSCEARDEVINQLHTERETIMPQRRLSPRLALPPLRLRRDVPVDLVARTLDELTA